MLMGKLFVFVLVLALSSFELLRFADSKVPQDEVDALRQIASTMGATQWEFDADSCKVISVREETPTRAEGTVNCNCFENNTCHVEVITLKWYNLPGMLPPELINLRYLKKIDFAYNYLNGIIPLEWASTQLESM